MRREIQSYTLDLGTVELLKTYANTNSISNSRAVEKILEKFFKAEGLDGVKPEVERVVTEEDHLKDWEWRKQMVADGRMHNYMAEEFPRIPTNANPFIEKTEEPVTTEEESENPLGDAITAKLKQ